MTTLGTCGRAGLAMDSGCRAERCDCAAGARRADLGRDLRVTFRPTVGQPRPPLSLVSRPELAQKGASAWSPRTRLAGRARVRRPVHERLAAHGRAAPTAR